MLLPWALSRSQISLLNSLSDLVVDIRQNTLPQLSYVRTMLDRSRSRLSETQASSVDEAADHIRLAHDILLAME
jgi:hypothetical protein